jgi:hypothetical protein
MISHIRPVSEIAAMLGVSPYAVYRQLAQTEQAARPGALSRPKMGA